MTKFKGVLFLLIVMKVLYCVSSKSFGEFINLANYMNTETLCSFNLTFFGKSVSEGCREQLTESCKNVTVLASVIDASSKFPYTGMAKATPRDYGGFDQCVDVDHNFDGGRILGKYCLFGLTLMDEFHNPISEGGYLLSVCMPDQCTAEDYEILFQNATMNITGKTFPGQFSDERCVTKETGTDITDMDLVTIVLFSTCFALMIICTTYDLYLKATNKKTKNPLYISFSVYSNGRKLLQTSKRGGKEQILIFHGLKIISMLWVIAGHGASIWQFNIMANQDDYDKLPDKVMTFYLSSAVLGVDTFFFLSGFLAGWGYMKKKGLSFKGHLLSTPLNYIHRYLRLTPALITIFLVQLSIFGHFGSGPVWHSLFEEIQGKCKRNWWAVLLYIQNYHNYDDVCMLQSWYLSADMQMYIVSPLILIPLAMVLKTPKRLTLSMIAMSILNIILTAAPIAIALSARDYKNNYATHTRLNTYFMGMMMGVFLHETRDRPFLSGKLGKEKIKLFNIVMWIASLIILFGVVITQRTTEIDGRYESLAYQEELKRPFWAAGLSWIIYSSYYGYGGFVNWLLTRPVMQIGGKLSYCIYLVHGLVVVYNVMVARTRQYYSLYQWFFNWCGHFVLATLIAFLWTLAFESPLITVEKFIFGTAGGKKKEKNQRKPPPIKPERYQQNGQTLPGDYGNNGNIATITKSDI